MKTVRVVAAIIRRGDQILATQRGYGAYKDYWEFPGGKVESNERPEDALRREIKEELNTEIQIGNYLTTIEYDYPEFHLSMRCYWATILEGSVTLIEHEDARWLTRDDLNGVNWLPADKTIIEMIRSNWIM